MIGFHLLEVPILVVNGEYEFSKGFVVGWQRAAFHDSLEDVHVRTRSRKHWIL